MTAILDDGFRRMRNGNLAAEIWRPLDGSLLDDGNRGGGFGNCDGYWK